MNKKLEVTKDMLREKVEKLKTEVITMKPQYNESQMTGRNNRLLLLS